MSQLINNTIEAYNLFLEGELNIEDLKYAIDNGILSESLLIELDNAMLVEESRLKNTIKRAGEGFMVGAHIAAPLVGIKYASKGVKDIIDDHSKYNSFYDHIRNHASDYGGTAAGLAVAGAGAYNLYKYLKNKKQNNKHRQ